MTKRKRGRPRGRPANHNLILRNGIWIFRLSRGGKDVHRSTGCPASEIAQARTIRDRWLGEHASKRHGIEEIPSALTLGKLIEAYLESESRPYDREKGGVQDGTKRDSEGDRRIVKRLQKHLDFALAADRIDPERLLDAGTSILAAGRVVNTKDGPKRIGDAAPPTVRGTFRLLRRIFGWARENPRKTGITANPFDGLSKTARKRLFPTGIQKEAPPFAREELRAIYELLPAHVYRPVRFGVHTAMRWQSELQRMVWGRVDLKRRVYAVDPNWAKRGKKRDVPLGDVAMEILREIRPSNPAPSDPVWLNSEGGPMRDVRDPFEKAVRKVCPAPRPGFRYPNFHSLRRTLATALSQLVPEMVVAAVLGHAKGSVTAGYVTVPLEAQLAAVNRAALLIDGEPQENVIPLAAPQKVAERRSMRN